MAACLVRGRGRADRAVRERGRRGEPRPPRPRGRQGGRLSRPGRAADVLRRLQRPGAGARRSSTPRSGSTSPRWSTAARSSSGASRSAPATRSPPTATCKEIYEKDGKGFYVFESVSTNQDGDETVRGTWTNIVEGGLMAMTDFKQGDSLPELRVTPDTCLTEALRGRVGRLQPDPHRPRVRQVGRAARQHPARPLLDGAGRARPHRGRRRRPARAEAALGPVPRHGRSRSRRSWSRARSRRPRTAAWSPTRSPRRATTRSSATPRPSCRRVASVGARPGGVRQSAVPDRGVDRRHRRSRVAEPRS